jgi:hypothetical protein
MSRLAIILGCLLLVPRICVAAEQDVGVSTWTISGESIILRYTFPKALATRLATPGAPLPPVEKIASYVLARVAARQQGEPCETLDQGYDLGRVDALYAGPDLFSFEILFRCPRRSGPLVISNGAFFDLAPAQIGIANIRVTGKPPISRVVTAGNTAVSMGAGEAPEPSRPGTYGWLGTQHALGTTLCLCMALGLSLLQRNRRELIMLVYGLFGGYVLAALAAGAGGWIAQPQPAQAFGGLLVTLIGALLAARNSDRPSAAALGLAVVVAVVAVTVAYLGHGTSAVTLVGAGVFGATVVTLSRDTTIIPWLLLVQGMLVGFVDGFSLASRFAPLHLVTSMSTAQLIAYNFGALVGIVGVVGAVTAARTILRRYAGFLGAPLYRDLLIASLAGIGVFSMLVL